MTMLTLFGSRSIDEVTERLDRLVSRIREIQRPYMRGECPADVVLVAHGLILRALVKRWLGYPVDMSLSIMLAPGALGILTYVLKKLLTRKEKLITISRYKNNDINDPALYIGLAISR